MTEKHIMTYDELVAHADSLSQTIHRHFPRHQLVAVSRGGVTLAHRVAYNLSKPLGFIIPSMPLQGLYTSPPTETPPLFIEDLIAKGRTLDIITSLAKLGVIHPGWHFAALVKDETYTVPTHLVNKVTTLITPTEWVVFPYEDAHRVKVGDWGLFREGTSENAKT